ncbi:MAG TPA: YraN family protein [Candidatus Agrococcus pullicola]|uniref:UPF0102 protein H9830_03600 n=1 Tax=Candidatus Agrococcus pullicola TaxID=2838429 RepID=A0A9D2C916_9MICO|nr:YraN family protein [Candidatus Agrococcus pullicola]
MRTGSRRLHAGGVDARTTLGRHGEELAANHLRSQGFTVIEQNWRCSAGELDIIARSGRRFVFVEVKTRRSTRFGHPLEAITREKALRLRALARAWMRERDASGPIRIDAVGILLNGSTVDRLDHVEGIA